MSDNFDNSQGTETQGTETQTQTSVVNQDGSFTEKWYEKYDKNDHATLKRYKNVDDLVGTTLSAKKKFGKDPSLLYEIPNEHTSDEARAKFHTARGVPDDIEGYKFIKGTDISEKVELTDAHITAYKEIAKKWNFNDKQFNGAVNDLLRMTGTNIDLFDNQMVEDDATALKEGNLVLNQVFKGEAGGRKVRANGLLDKYGLETVKMPDGSEVSIKAKLFEENPKLLSSPWMIMLLDKVADSMSEGTVKGITASTMPTGEQVDSQLADIRSEMLRIQQETPVNYKNNPKWKDLKQQKRNLYMKKTA